jgi:trimeric autotransporter adhesin
MDGDDPEGLSRVIAARPASSLAESGVIWRMGSGSRGIGVSADGCMSKGLPGLPIGRAALNASSPVKTIQETSTGSLAAGLRTPLTVNTGDISLFTLTPQGSLGCTAGESLTPGATCFLGAQFNPVALGNFGATFTEANITPTLPVVPSIMLSGIGAILTATSSKTVITSPATGNPQYSVAFTVTTTVAPAQCNTTAPSCVPTGTVQFFVGTTAVGIPVTLNSTGAASTSINGQNVGTLTVTVVYSGDVFYANSTAPALSVTVTTGSRVGVASACVDPPLCEDATSPLIGR